MKLRWGIIGCANIAVKSVIPAIQKSERGEVAAIASRGIEKAKETAAKLNIPKAYGSYEELVADPDIDAVYIPLPNHLHKEWTIKAAEAGKHVLCEKPASLTAEETEQMVAACKQAGVTFSEAFMYRYHPRVQRVREIIASGEIGELRTVHARFTFNKAEDLGNVRFNSEWGGGSIYDVGVYPLSAARWIIGSEPEAVTVHAQFSEQHGGVDMMASGLVEFRGGVALTFDCGMWSFYREGIEILGSNGRIVLDGAFKENTPIVVTTDNGCREEGAAEFEGLDSYTLQADGFAKAVFGEEPLPFPSQDAIANMRLVDVCLQSARTRSRVLVQQ
ncbi:Gfo/Idh/MocA family protein [Paenibacillus xylaniclasticus]|uniref:Gfo/Idh/MocA family protein n=1 Tax=Paenibacillus xylaniclasticus TaxID=588083 RepID=UPI000FD95E0D|nr:MULTISPECIES: Gfo/Idh/MocA family oxidoreductase [Paenibacillus]GFN32113.1 deoxyfructose oxidoreductase [Paenibacillus curdlanolyticus]